MSSERPLMPIDVDVALSAELEPVEFSWTSNDVQLYHLALGAGAGSDGCPRTAIPCRRPSPGPSTFSSVAASFHLTEPPTVKFPGIDIELSRVLHGSEAVTVAGPVPPSGTARATNPFHRYLGQGHCRGLGQ